MKKNLQRILILGLLVMASCGGSEDPEPPHIVGSWDLENFIIINLPSAYSQSEGQTFAISTITFGGASFTSYNISVANDGTYIRKVGLAGSPSANDQGSWTLSEDGTDLTITTDGADSGIDWDVVRNELDQLWISQPTTFGLFSDATRDQLAADHGDTAAINEYLNSLTDEEFQALIDPVAVDLLYAFKRGS